MQRTQSTPKAANGNTLSRVCVGYHCSGAVRLGVSYT